MYPQFAQRFRHSRAAAPPRQFQCQNLYRAVHADGEHFFHIGNVGIDRPMLDIRPKAANGSLYRFAVVRMAAHQARQRQQFNRPFHRQRFRHPAFGQAGARWFGGGFACLAFLQIRTKAASPQADFHAVRVKPQHPAIHRSTFIARNGPGVTTLRIVAAANKRPARPRRFQMQTPGATSLADPGIRSIGAQWIQMRA